MAQWEFLKKTLKSKDIIDMQMLQGFLPKNVIFVLITNLFASVELKCWQNISLSLQEEVHYKWAFKMVVCEYTAELLNHISMEGNINL